MAQAPPVALAECRRFPLLPQALVARSALEAAGLHPVVFDEFRAGVTGIEQFSLGGVRVMVPDQELVSARQLLAEIEGEPAPAAAPQPALFLVLLVSSWMIGWPIAGFRRPSGFHRVSALVISLLFVSLGLLAWWMSPRTY